jgi:hypothetical protein
MKTLLALILAAVSGMADDLAVARKKFEADTDAAIKPVRERYIAQLEGMKKTAMTKKDLEGAVAIDREIQRVIASAPNPTTEDILCAYFWEKKTDKWEFLRDGTLIQKGTGLPGKTWKLSEGGKVVEMYFAGGQKQFSPFKDGILHHFQWGAFDKVPKK